ncbi:MAG: hypothetical protein AAF363_00320 [Bacteroidota bacterium]
MTLSEVKTPEDEKEFILLPVELYANEPHYIRPLDKDIQSIFDPSQNEYFKGGDCKRWLLKDQNKTIGRVAAFFNENQATKGNDYPVGGVGFFECINDQEAANSLFEVAKEWLFEKGMKAFDGPVNFGERDKWWGCLIGGFDLEPNYCMPYNFPYYQQLFENYGFREYFKQFTFAKNLDEPLHPILAKKAERVLKDSEYEFRHIQKKNWKKHAEEFRTVYNKAWAGHSGVAEMSKEQSIKIMKQILPIMDETIIWFGYLNDEPVCFYVNLPEVNQIFKHVNGKLDLIGKIKFLYHQLVKTNRKAYGVVFGVSPEHQGKGLEGALIMATDTVMQAEKNRRYDLLEFNWIGDFNPRMIKLLKLVGCYEGKTHATYRYMIDETLEFKKPEILK